MGVAARSPTEGETTRERLALSFLDGAGTCFLIGLDLAGVARFWTLGAERFFGISARDAEGQPALDRLGLTRAALEEAAAKGEWLGRTELTRADGTKVGAALSLTRASGGLALIAGPAADSRDGCAVIAASAHDLRAPLNIVLGFAELLQSDNSGALLPAQREFVGEILRSGMQMLRMVATVTDFARANVGQLKLAPATFAPDSVVQLACNQVRQHAAERRIALELRLESRLKEVDFDPARFSQLIECALFDAVDLALEGGKVTLALASEARGLRLSIDSAPRGAAGTRLGLSLARKLVELLGGEWIAGSGLLEALLPPARTE